MNTKIPVTDIQTEMPDDIKEHSLREESRFRGKQTLAAMKKEIGADAQFGPWTMAQETLADIVAAYEEARELGNPDKINTLEYKINALEFEISSLKAVIKEQMEKKAEHAKAYDDIINTWRERYNTLEDEFDKSQDEMEIEIAKSDRLATERRRLVNVVQELVSLIK